MSSIITEFVRTILFSTSSMMIKFVCSSWLFSESLLSKADIYYLKSDKVDRTEGDCEIYAVSLLLLCANMLVGEFDDNIEWVFWIKELVWQNLLSKLINLILICTKVVLLLGFFSLDK